MGKKIWGLGVACALTALALMFVPSANAKDLPKVTWKWQLCCPPMSPAFIDSVGVKRTPDSIRTAGIPSVAKELARAVKERTDGKFQIKIFNAGELFSVPQAYEALEKGAVEMWFGPPWAFSGRNPIGYVSGSLPYSITNHDQAYDIMYKTKFREIIRRAYGKNNIYYISGAMGGADGYTTTFPVRSMKDLKGKKIRGGGIKGKVNSALGAIDVKIAPNEIYTALQRGVIDGAIMPLFVFGEWGFFEVTKYVSLPPVFGNWWIDWACNMDAWNDLPQEYQHILQEESDKIWKWCLKILLPHIERSEQFKWSQRGVEYIRLSDDALNEIRGEIDPIWGELAEMSPENAEVVDIFKNYLDLK
jgi:TRAP-type C4-dicarboxylate transport system substrate-binding protein